MKELLAGLVIGAVLRDVKPVLVHRYNLLPWVVKREQARRRANYELLKEKIKERHLAGFAGLVVDFGHFDQADMHCFRAPMYGTAKNQKGDWCIFWDRKMLINEIGTGAPLRDGEVINPDATKPEKLWQKSPDDIDNQIPLTTQAKALDGSGQAV